MYYQLAIPVGEKLIYLEFHSKNEPKEEYGDQVFTRAAKGAFGAVVVYSEQTLDAQQSQAVSKFKHIKKSEWKSIIAENKLALNHLCHLSTQFGITNAVIEEKLKVSYQNPDPEIIALRMRLDELKRDYEAFAPKYHRHATLEIIDSLAKETPSKITLLLVEG